MSKKLKLIITIGCLLVVVAMIPVAIFAATQTGNFSITNKISFVVKDIQGSFSYRISGVSEGEVRLTEENIFKAYYDSTTGVNDFVVDPGDYCYTETEDDIDDIYYITNDKVEKNGINVKIPAVENSNLNPIINFDFIFVNKGETVVNFGFEIKENTLSAFNSNLSTNTGASVSMYYGYYSDTLSNTSIFKNSFDTIDFDSLTEISTNVNTGNDIAVGDASGNHYGLYRLQISLNATGLNSAQIASLNDYLNGLNDDNLLSFDLAFSFKQALDN